MQLSSGSAASFTSSVKSKVVLLQSYILPVHPNMLTLGRLDIGKQFEDVLPLNQRLATLMGVATKIVTANA